jgi:hypothetical protein
VVGGGRGGGGPGVESAFSTIADLPTDQC